MKSINIRRPSIIWVNIIILFLFFTNNTVVNGQAEIRKNDSTLNTKIYEENFIFINGIEQWITIKGERSKPVILFVHGGPGSPISPYSDILYKDLEKDFIIVQWDQRGSGRTFGKNSPEELTPEYLNENPLSLDLMANDGIELSKYLLKYLGKKKSFYSVLPGALHLV